MARNELTAERLREVLDYDFETGIFRWRGCNPRGRPAGRVAGCVNNQGYIVIGVDYVMYQASRLAWLYVTGEWPKEMVDHKDLDPLHNWFSNLREASNSQNQMNKRRTRENQSGYKGVWFHAGRYTAAITTDGKPKHLGRFKTPEAAHAAYAAASLSEHGEFGRVA